MTKTHSNLITRISFNVIPFVLLACSSGSMEQELKVIFPDASEPIQITKYGKEHLFASYFGINSFVQEQKYATVLQTDIKYKLPTENDPITQGLVELEIHKASPNKGMEFSEELHGALVGHQSRSFDHLQ